MRPTRQQVKVLQQYLHNTLTYCEAYNEIYDHILTALEFQPEDISFEDAINNVINSDFGSPKNLLKVEKNIKETLVSESIKRYQQHLLSYFKFPAVFGTAAGTLLIYYLLVELNIRLIAIAGLLVMICFIPGIIWMLRLYNTGYILDTTRKSSKDKLFETLAGIPIRVSAAIIFLNTVILKVESWEDKRYLITIVLSAGILYSLALYRLYKDEFKTEIIKRF